MITILLFLGLITPLSDSEQIMQVLDQQTKCWNEGNLACFMEGYWQSKELMFIGSSGITYGWNNTLSNYEKRYPDEASRGVLAFDITKVSKITSEVYLIVGKYHLSRTIGDANGHFTLTFKKIRKEWKIVADHTCADD